MWIAFYAIAGVLGLVAVTCALIIVVHAFRQSTKQGLLCLFVPCYILYFAFAKLEHPRKGLLLAGMIASPILAAVAANVATAVFGPDVLRETRSTDGDTEGEGGDLGKGEGDDDEVDFDSDFEDF